MMLRKASFWILAFKIFTATVLLSIFLYGIMFERQLRCLFASSSDLRAIAPDTYAEPWLDEGAEDSLLLLVRASNQRVTQFWGERKASPTIIFAKSNEYLERFGGPGLEYGVTHITPFGTAIVIGPFGTNVDVLSHELMHTELVARTGWWAREQKIPTWFDEGLALLVDFRYINGEGEWLALTNGGENAPKLSDLTTMDGFQEITLKSPYLSYYTSMREVARTWKEVGSEGLDSMLMEIKKGTPFEDAYSKAKTRR